MINEINKVLEFWLNLDSGQHFQKNNDFDKTIQIKFGRLVVSAFSGEYFHDWSKDSRSCLALIILLDQFSRNIYRDSPKAFFGDEQARVLSRLSVEKGFTDDFDLQSKFWFMMPLMHSENLIDQEESLIIFKELGFQPVIDAAQEHYDIIKKFGRFPHRNKILGRKSTKEEIKFLDEGGFRG